MNEHVPSPFREIINDWSALYARVGAVATARQIPCPACGGSGFSAGRFAHRTNLEVGGGTCPCCNGRCTVEA